MVLCLPEDWEYEEMEDCESNIECLRKFYAQMFPASVFGSVVGDNKTVLSVLLKHIFHEHQTDDGAFWEAGEGAMKHVVCSITEARQREEMYIWARQRAQIPKHIAIGIFSVDAPADREKLASDMWNTMYHN